MKQFLIIFAVAAVLTASIFARAANETKAVDVAIQKVNFNANTMIVKVAGHLPTLCAASPRPELRLTKEAGVLELAIEAKQHGDICISVAMVGGVYELAFDIRSLKYDIEQLKLDTAGTYKIVASNGEFVAEVDFGKIAFEFPFATHEVSGGEFQVMNDGRYMIVIDASTSVEVRSPFISLNKYVGKHIDLSGIVIKSQNPVIGGGQVEKPLFLLTGLNTTTH